MIGKYNGHYSYDKPFIMTNAPDEIGIYYLGLLNGDGSLGVLYVGRAKGEDVSIKSRLLNHLNNNEWPDVTHFGFCICDSEGEATAHEVSETKRLNYPKYNQRAG
ncbi:hypothetical protein A2115_00375 [Candidatus Woesebacteria bacterium GWA1_41_8]|uniref:GIY-YIG domain-containing protein n=1 Tax=Candidatus Woesebacteria bacterium GWA1_41_8 TaxID=1802471 RepID=A0A1F7WGE2_9BACT|nr:MAG: hypothetical protein A2115_00375 [Candidatus Woesebacteria bacterium GWA1_41_8]